jgi:hypothetical protein
MSDETNFKRGDAVKNSNSPPNGEWVCGTPSKMKFPYGWVCIAPGEWKEAKDEAEILKLQHEAMNNT